MKIPIQVNKNNQIKQTSDELKVDLRDNKGKKQPRSLARLFLNILFIIIVIILFFWILLLPKTPFIDFKSDQAAFFSIINLDSFYQQTSPFEVSVKGNYFYGKETTEKVKKYLSLANLDFAKDIKPLFKKEIALIVFPEDTQSVFPFLLILEKKDSSIKLEKVLSEIEFQLKKEYNFSSVVYRQIDLISLNSVSSPSSPARRLLTYCQIGNYFLISNSCRSLEQAIDSIIDS
jgi:hypothetical protein